MMMMMMMHHLCVSLPLAIGPSLIERWTWNLSTAQQSQCKLYIYKTGTDVSAQVFTGKNFKDKPSACHILELNLGRWMDSPAFFFFFSVLFFYWSPFGDHLTWGKLQQPQEQRYPFLTVLAVFS